MSTVPIAQGPVDVNVRWLPGWYASRLHAVPNANMADGLTATHAICGAVVYSKARTEWAQRKVDKGVPHCKLCEKKLTPNVELTGGRDAGNSEKPR